MTTMENLIRFHAWESEIALRQMRDPQRGVNIETFTVVIDAEGWALRLATSDAMAFIRSLSTIHS